MVAKKHKEGGDERSLADVLRDVSVMHADNATKTVAGCDCGECLLLALTTSITSVVFAAGSRAAEGDPAMLMEINAFMKTMIAKYPPKGQQ